MIGGSVLFITVMAVGFLSAFIAGAGFGVALGYIFGKISAVRGFLTEHHSKMKEFGGPTYE